MATHSGVLAWRLPGMGEPGGLPSMGSHRVGHDWSNLVAARESDGCELGLEQWSFCNIYTYEVIMMYIITRAFQVVLVVKKKKKKKSPAANAGEIRDMGSVPGSGRSPGAGHGNPLQYSCLENPMYRAAWQATVHKITKSQTWLKRLRTHAYQN